MDLLAETNEDGVGNWVFGDKQHEDEEDGSGGDLRSSIISVLIMRWCIIAMVRPVSAMWS